MRQLLVCQDQYIFDSSESKLTFGFNSVKQLKSNFPFFHKIHQLDDW